MNNNQDTLTIETFNKKYTPLKDNITYLNEKGEEVTALLRWTAESMRCVRIVNDKMEITEVPIVWVQGELYAILLKNVKDE